MRRRRLPLRVAIGLAAVVGGLGAPAWGADTYRWVDQQGRVNYSDRPPPPNVRAVVEKQFDATAADTAPTYSVRKATEDFPVELYTTDTCGEACDEARSFLGKRGVPFTEHKVATEADIATYRERFGTPEEVPAITVGRQTAKGYESVRWTRMLDDAGYPKSPQPPR